MELTPGTTAWATDYQNKTGRIHRWYIGDRFAISLCGKRNQLVSDLQPESDGLCRCKTCQAVET